MPHEAKAFAAVDRQLRATNRAASASANALHTALVPGLLLSLQRHNSTLEKIGKNLEVRAWGRRPRGHAALPPRRHAPRMPPAVFSADTAQGRAQPLQGFQGRLFSLLHAPPSVEHACMLHG
jgi:hypothetical protein